jgi:hypothetical protein
MSHFHQPRTFALSVGFVALSIVYSAQLTLLGLSQDQYPVAHAALHGPMPMPQSMSRSASSTTFHTSAPTRPVLRATRKEVKATKPVLRHYQRKYSSSSSK